MILNKKYTYEKLLQVTDPETGSRYYETPIGEKLDSVTTILSNTSHNEGLENWKKWVGLQEAERIRTEATNLGSLMHDHLEKFVNGDERPSGNNLIRIMAHNMANTIIDKGLSKVTEVWATESPLYLPGKYAGTTDLVGLFKGIPSIMDYKTSKKVKSKSDIGDYFCQSVAYAVAHNFLHGTDIQQVVIFMVTRENKYLEFVIDSQEFPFWQTQWEKRLEKYLEFKTALDSK